MSSSARSSRILEVLARHQVQCVVIGGYAAVLAGIDIVTRDIDITPAIQPANLQRLGNALRCTAVFSVAAVDVDGSDQSAA